MFDVIVIGAGPAGAHAARLCAGHGMNTLLLEKERLPRDKPCGGATSENIFETLGGGCRGLVKSRSERARIFLDFDEIVGFGQENVYFDRAELDSFTTRAAVKAGAVLEEGASVRSIRVVPGGVQVFSERDAWFGKMVIGSDGVNSVVRKCSGLESYRERPDRLVSSVLELRCGSSQVSGLLRDGQGRLCYNSYFFTGMTGLGWVFPKGDGFNIGMGSLVGRGGTLRERFGRMLGRLGLDISLSGRAKWHLIPSRPLRKIYADKVLLVGDAAGFANPLTGAGIETGLASAEQAATAARRALLTGDFSEKNLREYQSRCSWLLRSLNMRARLLGMMDYFVARRLDTQLTDRFVLKNFSRLASV